MALADPRVTMLPVRAWTVTIPVTHHAHVHHGDACFPCCSVTAARAASATTGRAPPTRRLPWPSTSPWPTPRCRRPACTTPRALASPTSQVSGADGLQLQLQPHLRCSSLLAHCFELLRSRHPCGSCSRFTPLFFRCPLPSVASVQPSAPTSTSCAAARRRRWPARAAQHRHSRAWSPC